MKENIKKNPRCIMNDKCPRKRQIPKAAIIVKTGQGEDLSCQYKDFFTRNTNIKYKIPITYH
jgi:hypothetical protein